MQESATPRPIDFGAIRVIGIVLGRLCIMCRVACSGSEKNEGRATGSETAEALVKAV